MEFIQGHTEGNVFTCLIIKVLGQSLADYKLDKETLAWVEWCLSMII